MPPAWLMGIENFLYILFFFAVIWVLGRLGDNVNRIRRMLEEEIKRKHHE